MWMTKEDNFPMHVSISANMHLNTYYMQGFEVTLGRETVRRDMIFIFIIIPIVNNSDPNIAKINYKIKKQKMIF